MKREPDDSAAIGAIFASWSNEEDRRGQQQERLKQLFANAKDAGFNTKALRVAFKEHYRLQHQSNEEAAKRSKSDEDVELYLTALARVPAHARKDNQSTAARKDVHQHLARRGEVTSDGTQLNTDQDDENPQGGNVVPDTRQPAAGTQAPPVDTPSQLEETQRQSESQQRRDDGSQPIQSLHIEAAIPAIDADLDGAASLAGAEGEADRQPHSEPEVHTSWLKPAPLEGQLRSKAGLPRMPGCANIDACAGMWNRRCYTCEREWKITHADAPTEAA